MHIPVGCCLEKQSLKKHYQIYTVVIWISYGLVHEFVWFEYYITLVCTGNQKLSNDNVNSKYENILFDVRMWYCCYHTYRPLNFSLYQFHTFINPFRLLLYLTHFELSLLFLIFSFSVSVCYLRNRRACFGN